jgi:ferredoxin
MALLNEYLKKKLIFDNHPSPDESACLNTIQDRNPCQICKKVCPTGVFDQVEPNWDKCLNCGICVASCPVGCISYSAYHSQALLGLLRSGKRHVSLSCRQTNAQTDLILPCLAACSWEFLGLLALNKQITIIRCSCTGCLFADGMTVFDETLLRLKTLLGEDVFSTSIYVSDHLQPQEISSYTRREAFSHLLGKTKSGVQILLPDKADGDRQLYRKLLARYLPRFLKETFWLLPQFTPECIACGLCSRICPGKALYRISDEENPSLLHMALLPHKCTGCGLCYDVCPQKGLSRPEYISMNDPSSPFINSVLCLLCSRCGEPIGKQTDESDPPMESLSSLAHEKNAEESILCQKCRGELGYDFRY